MMTHRASSRLSLVLGGIALLIGPSQVRAQCEPLLEQKLVGSAGQPYRMMGEHMAISGGTIMVGASGGAPEPGSVFFFERDGNGQWTEVDRIGASDGAPGNLFGLGVAIDGDTAVVGAPGANNYYGKAYVFRNDGSGHWNEVQSLEPPNRTGQDWYGQSVAISGDTVFVGSTDHDNGFGVDAGTVYVFHRDGNGVWELVDQLHPSSAGAYQYFGYDAGVSGDVAIFSSFGVYSTGSATLFRKDGNDRWIEVDSVTQDPGWGRFFGMSASVSGDIAVVSGRERTLVFRNDGNDNWERVTHLEPAQGWNRNDDFGVSVRVSDSTILIGALSDTSNGIHAGAAYVFRSDAFGQWFEAAKLLPPDGEGDDQFGAGVAIAGDLAVAGSIWSKPGVPEGSFGAAYAFDLACHGPSLGVAGDCPGPMDFAISGASPNAPVAFLYASAVGQVSIPSGRACAGTVLGLNRSVQLARIANTDAHGDAHLRFAVPARACGAVFVQAIDGSTCLTSNVVGF